MSHTQQQSMKGPRRLLRWLSNLAWTVFGVLLLAISLDIFGSTEPRTVVNLIVLIALLAAGVVVWYLDVRRERKSPWVPTMTSDPERAADPN